MELLDYIFWLNLLEYREMLYSQLRQAVLFILHFCALSDIGKQNYFIREINLTNNFTYLVN